MVCQNIDDVHDIGTKIKERSVLRRGGCLGVFFLLKLVAVIINPSKIRRHTDYNYTSDKNQKPDLLKIFLKNYCLFPLLKCIIWGLNCGTKWSDEGEQSTFFFWCWGNKSEHFRPSKKCEIHSFFPIKGDVEGTKRALNVLNTTEFCFLLRLLKKILFMSTRKQFKCISFSVLH